MSNKSKTIIVIPARYASVRFPGKLLADLEGKPVIQWVYEKAMSSKADDVWIATDDKKIMEVVADFNGKAVMTSSDHPSGTDRIWEAVQKITSSPNQTDEVITFGGVGAETLDDASFKSKQSEEAEKQGDCPVLTPNQTDEVIINLQGDEPLLSSEVIDDLIDMMLKNPALEMATVAVKASREEIENDPNRVKVVKGESSDRALYFTRAAAPFLREGGEECGMLLHWGIYAFRKSTLKKIVALPESSLEKCEKLEQLRALEAGINIHVLITDKSTVGIDTPEDLEIVKKILKNK